MKEKEYFKGALINKKVPILVLDQKWHRLFAIHGKSDEIQSTEEELNHLIARQGQANQDIKDLKKVKASLMESIVAHMDESDEQSNRPSNDKIMDENTRLINEVNEKIEACEDELLELPKQIKDANERLMLASMEFCYEKLRTNDEEIKEIDAWIKQVRIDLKKNIIKKQNREIRSKLLCRTMSAEAVNTPCAMQKSAPAVGTATAETILKKKKNKKAGALPVR